MSARKISQIRMWRTRIVSEWKKFNSEFVVPKGQNRVRMFSDYIVCVLKYHITYSEYFEQYKFYAIKKCERDEFITMSQAHKIEGRLNKGVRDHFWYKDRFLQRFAEFVKRDWINLNKTSPEDFIRFCQAHPRFIVKPLAESRGAGIRLVTINYVEDIAKLYNELSAGNYIAEELIIACDEIAEFNPGSLNTVRVVTYSNEDRFHVIGSVLRMGVRGSQVDNAHAGGVFARIDVSTGVISTEGITTSGERYILHPTSGKQIIGFRIPHWEDIIETCRKASRSIPEAKIVGWDIAVRKDYSIVIIEGNHMPDFDLMQSPARKGVKKEFLEIVNS